jgi:hypothetical protein
MAHLFLSYAREDRECAEILARALSSRGWSVWWDRQIQVGRSFSEVIEQELEKARCVIVLWSRHAVASEWVQSEAAEAASRKVLVPVRIENVRPPLEFRRLHTADLLDWRKGFDNPDFDACLASIELLVRKTASRPLPAPSSEEPEVSDVAANAQDQQREKPRITHADFWISQDGQQYRAPDVPTLRRWAEEGRVRPDGHVHDPGLQRWIAAREHPGLQGAFAPSTVSTQSADRHEAPVRTAESRGSRNALRFALAVGLLLLIAILAGIIYDAVDWADDSTLPDTMAMDIPTTDTVVTAADTAVKNAPAQPIAVSIQNLCANKTIAVAVCYLDTTNTWFSEGWYVIAPKETKSSIVQAMGPVVYFYGVSVDLDKVWLGGESDLKYVALIDTAKGFRAPDQQLKGDTVKAVSFFGSRVDAGQTAYTQNFTCQ